MSEPNDPKHKPDPPPSSLSPVAGRSARPGAIGAELGVSELDFETDALLESAFGEYSPEAALEPPRPAVPGAKTRAPALAQTHKTEDDQAIQEKPAQETEAPWAALDRAPPPLPTRKGPLPPIPSAPPRAAVSARPEPLPRPKLPPVPRIPEPGRPPSSQRPRPPAVPGALRAPGHGAASDESLPSFERLPAGALPTARAFGAGDPSDSWLEHEQDEHPTHEAFSSSPPTRPGPDGEALEGGLLPFEDPHDGLESLPPPEPDLAQAPVLTHSVVPAASGGLTWDDERPAAAQLTEQGLRGDWLARAEWMESEADSVRDPSARARMLIVSSELWAMAGDVRRAREAARRAADAAPAGALVARQLRWLAAVERDFEGVRAALDIETRSAATPEARLHAALLNSDLCRVVLQDAQAAQKNAEMAGRIKPADPRVALMRVAQILSQPGQPQALKLPDAPELATLARAATELGQIRGTASTEELGSTPGRPPVTAHVALQIARRALADRDTARAAEALALLGGAPGLGRGALWLAATLFARDAATRRRSIPLLSALLRDQRSPAAVRALAARYVELGDLGELWTLLERLGSSEAFDVVDQVTFGVLLGEDPEAARPWLALLAAEDAYRPLASAGLSAVSPPADALDLLSGNPRSRAEMALGRALANPAPGPLETAFSAFMEANSDAPLGPALALELAVAQRDGRSVATELRQLGLGQEPSKEAERDHHLAAALVYEVSGALEEAEHAYAAALSVDPGHEAATRAQLSPDDPAAQAALLVNLSEQIADDTHRALCLVEAAVRSGPDDLDYYRNLLERAVKAAPDLPFVYRMGEELARAQGDAAELVGWLRRRRQVATDPGEAALDLAREALLVADTDIEQARKLMEEAAQARPGDVALHELYERLSPGAGTDKGAWREAAAAASRGGKLPLLLTAAVEYERAGDHEAASRCALSAADLGDSDFAVVMAERLGATGAGAARLSEQLFARARTEDDPVVQRELYEQLSRIDRARGDQQSALLWQSAILERTPGYLPALRVLEHAYIGAARDAELEATAMALAQRLEGAEAVAHAALAARIRTRTRGWLEAKELVALAAKSANRSLWTLRQLAAYSRFSGDDEQLLPVYEELADRVSHALDVATLALRAAETAVRLGQIDRAKALLERAVDIVPNHLIALATQAEVLEGVSDFEGAAEALEAAAQVSNVDGHKVSAWHQAAVLWLDKVADRRRGLIALERAADLDITHEDVFVRLQALYVAEQDRPRLADLLQRRLDRTTEPHERVALEVTRGKALAEVGDRAAAKAALTAALEADPEHAEALDALAELSLVESDWKGAEEAWLRLAGHARTPERQAAIYLKLADLYSAHLDNLSRAELSYQEVLKRIPGDSATEEKLVKVYTRLGNSERALELQNRLVEQATSPEDKRRYTLGLAVVYLEAAKDPKKAEAILEQMRKAWPQDALVLRARAEFHQRQGDQRALQLLLDRSTADARRALNTGRFEPHLFEILGTVAELKGAVDLARVTEATLLALEGQPSELPGVGQAAAQPDLDELTAPDPLNIPCRLLLRELGSALDQAFAVDFRSVRAGPLPAEAAEFGGRVAELGAAFELGPIEAFVSPALGAVCLPASSTPCTLVLGSQLLDALDDPATWFLVVRCLKILSARAAALSRAAPIDLWPMAAALLSLLVPGWRPQAVDTKRLEESKARLASHLPHTLSPELQAAAHEVTGTLGNRGSQLGTAVNQWGNRVALLALGSPTVALRALALGLGASAALPPSGQERIRWIVRHPEARDLTVYGVSETYVEARKRAGVSEP
jgi:tetratricopeptide (TPR) repeat protein